MSGGSAQSQEPSMEEILASIRKIISEDGSETEAAPSADDVLAAEPALDLVEPAPPAPTMEDPLSNLTPPPAPGMAPPPMPEMPPQAAPMAPPPMPEMPPQAAPMAPPPMPEMPSQAAPMAPPPMPEMPLQAAPMAPQPMPEMSLSPPAPMPNNASGLVGDSVALQTASAFERLTPAPPTHEMDISSATSLEMMVANLLRPALKDWLETNLPGIVEEHVSRELARIRNMGR